MDKINLKIVANEWIDKNGIKIGLNKFDIIFRITKNNNGVMTFSRDAYSFYIKLHGIVDGNKQILLDSKNRTFTYQYAVNLIIEDLIVDSIKYNKNIGGYVVQR